MNAFYHILLPSNLGLISPGHFFSRCQLESAGHLTGTVRRECLDQMLIFGEAQPRCTFPPMRPITITRAHLALKKGAPYIAGPEIWSYCRRPNIGRIAICPDLLGKEQLHHRYGWA